MITGFTKCTGGGGGGTPTRNEEIGQTQGGAGSKAVLFTQDIDSLATGSWWIEVDGIVWTQYERSVFDNQVFIFQMSIFENVVKLVWLT